MRGRDALSSTSRHTRDISEGSRVANRRSKMAPRSASTTALALILAVLGVISPQVADATATGTTKPEIRLSDTAARRLLSAYDHTYKLRETVPLYANKVGPFHNPSEVRTGRSPDPTRRRSRHSFIR